VYLIMDEFILAGEVQETSKKVCWPLPSFGRRTHWRATLGHTHCGDTRALRR